MPPQLARLDTRVFDETIRPLLQRLPQEKIPNALNRKMFFVVLRTLRETPRTNPFKILSELGRPVTLRREDGSTGTAPIGYAIAAKRAHKEWTNTTPTGRRKRGNLAVLWRKLIDKKLDKMFGGRMASSAFIAAGWAASLAAIAPFVRNKQGQSYRREGVKLRGAMKGKAQPAKPGWSPVVSVENSASAKSDKRNGLIKYGEPALQRAWDAEMADWVPYLEKEVLEQELKEFNSKQR